MKMLLRRDHSNSEEHTFELINISFNANIDQKLAYLFEEIIICKIKSINLETIKKNKNDPHQKKKKKKWINKLMSK